MSSRIDLNDKDFLESIADFSLSGDGSNPIYKDEILAVGPPSVVDIDNGMKGTESAPGTYKTPKLRSHLPSAIVQSRPAPSTINEEDEVIYENNQRTSRSKSRPRRKERGIFKQTEILGPDER